MTIYSGTLEGLRETSGHNIIAPTALKALLGRQHLPTVYNYSLGIQWQIGRSMLLDASYVGSLARHLLWQRNINPVPIGATHVDLHPENRDPTGTKTLANNFLRPYQGFGDIFADEFGSTSNYNSFQFSLMRRASRGLRVGLSYTFSKGLGTAAADDSKVSPFFPPREHNYGPLSYDRTHVASIWYNYTLPKPGRRLNSRPLGWLADNWDLSGTTRMIAGGPFTPDFTTVDNQDITGTPSERARVLVLDPHAPSNQRFGRPARDTFGNAGVGVMRLPGVNNWDMSLFRRILVNERVSFQLRVETYNTFNHTQFSDLHRKAKFDVTGAQVDPLFLQPSTARGPRRLQLAIRLNW